MRTWKSLKQMTLVQFRSFFRNKSSLFWSLMLPLVFLAVFGAMYGGSTSTPAVKVGVVDLDQSQIAADLQKALGASGVFTVVTGDEAALRTSLGKGDLQAVLVLPAGLGRQVAARQRASVTVLYDPTSQSSDRAVGALNQALAGFNAMLQGSSPLLAAQVEPLPGSERLNVFDFLMPAELAFMLLNANVIGAAIALVSQRQSGILRHLFSTPLSLGVWLSARILSNLLLAFVQCALIIGAGMWWFKVHLPGDLVGTTVVLLLSALSALGVGLLIGSLFKNVESAQPLAVLISMVLAFLGNAWMPLDGAPAVVQTLTKFMPSEHMTHALKLVMMQNQGLGAVASDLAILAGWMVLCLGFAAWRLRRQLAAA